MRIAIFSDIHGNPIALEAVLADIEAQGGVDGYWILGDLAAIGPEPVAVLERVATLPGARIVSGNTERYLLTGDRPPPSVEEVLADPRLLPTWAEVVGSFAWTQGVVTAMGWMAWLESLPLEARLDLPDGTRVLGLHVAPGQDDGPGLHAGLGQSELAALAEVAQAELVFAGHTHRPLDVRAGGVRFVNVGCVSMPKPPDLRASYVMLDADEDGHQLALHYVDYDHEAVIQISVQLRYPAAPYVACRMRGQDYPSDG